MDQMIIGQYIGKKRREKNLTQAQLAEMLAGVYFIGRILAK